MADRQGLLARLARAALREAPRVLREAQRAAARNGRAAARPSRRPARTAGPPAPGSPAPRGRHLAYAPQPDGRADPGEVVWAWVPYEEDAGRGKDRPVLVVGRDGRALLGLMLSSQPAREGQPGWLGLGPGAWDREQRASWVRLDRVLAVDEDGIRREGAVLDRSRFDLVAAALRRDHGWR